MRFVVTEAGIEPAARALSMRGSRQIAPRAGRKDLSEDAIKKAVTTWRSDTYRV